MNFFKHLFIMLICLLFLTTATNAYSFTFGTTEKAESIKAYDKAQELYDENNYKSAISEYKDFMHKYPDSMLNEVSLYYLGKCYTHEDNYDQALTYYEKLITEYKEGFWADSAKDEVMKLRAKIKKD